MPASASDPKEDERHEYVLSMFAPELRTAGIVPRWSIMVTTAKDYVAGHSYFVTLYAHQIAKLIEWDGPLDKLLFSALMHDTVEEIFTGDIPGPVKHNIIHPDNSRNYVRQMARASMPAILDYTEAIDDSTWGGEIKAIISVADKLDALLFLISEKRLGNSIAAKRIPELADKVQSAWRKLPIDNALRLLELWNEVMNPAILRHYDNGGSGVW